MTRQTIFTKAIQQHTFHDKLEKLEEETLELTLAIKRFRSVRPGSEKNLVEEIADVKNVIEQIEMYSDQIKKDISKMQETKALKLNHQLNKNQ